LSSGKRINGAADDAAGLAISEKMKSQTRGLAQAQRNAQDGISMIQTTEGALKESHAILQRMRELAVQSSNDTNTKADRAEIQKEVDQLSSELTRIGETTEFNTQKLLDGTLTDTKFQIGANKDQNMSISVNDMRANSLGVSDKSTEVTSGATVAISGGENYSVVELDASPTTGSFTSATHALVDDSGNYVAASTNGSTFDVLSTASTDLGTASDASVDLAFSTEVAGTLSIDEGTTTAGTATYTAETGINVSDQTKANEAIKTLDTAISDVSAERSKLGAIQNRLDHTINNLNTAEENLTAAESRISDVDMAKEMMSFTKNQILSQAGTAMMAQANQLPQGVLQLLG